jgi:hypothetical protein
VHWDWQSRDAVRSAHRSALRWTLTIPAHSWRYVVIAGHSGSRETLFLEADGDDRRAGFYNTRADQRCIEVVPLCKGTYQVQNLVDAPMEVAWQTPVYSFYTDATSGAADVSSSRWVRPLGFWNVSTLGTHKREVLFAWLAENSGLQRREARKVHRFEQACDTDNLYPNEDNGVDRNTLHRLNDDTLGARYVHPTVCNYGNGDYNAVDAINVTVVEGEPTVLPPGFFPVYRGCIEQGNELGGVVATVDDDIDVAALLVCSPSNALQDASFSITAYACDSCTSLGSFTFDLSSTPTNNDPMCPAAAKYLYRLPFTASSGGSVSMTYGDRFTVPTTQANGVTSIFSVSLEATS